ncbi:DUF6517 family protein [Natronobeatus ordinarius]|uniref:DUF6517 family protein n=1 Tax=Natronobeatus ordinarius TaxID=2963433 RepID=UPI0020CCDAF7|nr:DUF6517 family protein [Natronobeatus ordinarius]
MQSRRSFLAAGATGTLALSAGCLGVVLGTEPIEFTASRAAPSTASLESTGYTETQSNEELLEETVDVGVSREIRASYWLVTHSKEVDLQDAVEERLDEAELDETGLEEADDVDLEETDDVDLEEADDVDLGEAELDDVDLEAFESQEAAFFVAVSMPGIEVLGRSFNPLEELGSEELIDELLSQSGDEDDVGQVEPAGSISLPILGADRDVDRFEATTEVEGEAVELDLSITSFTHEDDLLVLLGGHPAVLEDEADDLATLFESVEHPL